MKEKLWQQRAAETQLNADNGNTRWLFLSLKYINGPKKNATVPVFSLDGKTLLTSTEYKKERWTEQFTQLLSETSTLIDSVINTLPQRPEETCPDEIPTIQEVEKAISQIKDRIIHLWWSNCCYTSPQDIREYLDRWSDSCWYAQCKYHNHFQKRIIDTMSITTTYSRWQDHDTGDAKQNAWSNRRGSAPRITMRLSTKPWPDGYDLRCQTTNEEGPRTTS